MADSDLPPPPPPDSGGGSGGGGSFFKEHKGLVIGGGAAAVLGALLLFKRSSSNSNSASTSQTGATIPSVDLVGSPSGYTTGSGSSTTDPTAFLEQLITALLANSGGSAGQGSSGSGGGNGGSGSSGSTGLNGGTGSNQGVANQNTIGGIFGSLGAVQGAQTPIGAQYAIGSITSPTGDLYNVFAPPAGTSPTQVAQALYGSNYQAGLGFVNQGAYTPTSGKYANQPVYIIPNSPGEAAPSTFGY